MDTDAGTGFMHESFSMKDDPKKLHTRLVCMANTLFGELIFKVGQRRKNRY